MKTLGAGEDNLKKLTGFVTEKLGRLKLNGSLFSYSPLSRVVELEGLYLGVTGKRALWVALEDLGDPRLTPFGLAALIERADRQREGLEEHRRRAAAEAFAGDRK
jgi:hypothetical protein